MDLVEQFVRDPREDPEVSRPAWELLLETWHARDASDRTLVRHARHWQLSRLALVDRNILRLAVHEMLSARAPRKVAISEAIRLAKEFSTAESPRFVNGVLDAVAREIERDTTK